MSNDRNVLHRPEPSDSPAFNALRKVYTADFLEPLTEAFIAKYHATGVPLVESSLYPTPEQYVKDKAYPDFARRKWKKSDGTGPPTRKTSKK